MVRVCVSYHSMTNLYSRYYGYLCSHCGFFTVSINGSTLQRLNAPRDPYLSQQMIWSNTSLGPGRHTITLTHDDDNRSFLFLDFFRSVITYLKRQR